MNQLTLFSKLIVNELYKSFFQKKTIAFFGVMTILICVMAYFIADADAEGNWRKDMDKKVVAIEKQIEEAKKATNPDQAYITSLNENLKELQYRLDNNIPDNVTSPLKFIYNCSQFFTMVIFLFMTAFSADMIASEYSAGTIRQILVKPVKRWKIFVSKFIASFIVSASLFAYCLIVATIVGMIVFGDNPTSKYEISVIDGEIVKFNLVSTIGWSYLAHLFALVVVSTLTFFIATLTRRSAVAIILSFVVFFGGSMVGELLMQNLGVGVYQYFLTPNIMLSNYLPGSWIPFEGATFGFSLTICLTYAVVFLTAGLFIFNKRDVY